MTIYSAHVTPLMTAIADLIQASASENIPQSEEWKTYVHPLAHKFYRHLVSAFLLCEKTTITSTEEEKLIEFVDHTSVHVLVRAALETYIVFHYLTSGETDDENNYRTMTWRMGGLIDRQKLTASFEETVQKQKAEKADIEILRKRIEQHPSFKALTDGQQRLVMKGDWSYKTHWHELAKNADIETIVFSNIYNHLCGQAHSSYISAMQLKCAKTLNEQRTLATGLMSMMLQTMAYFIQAFVKFIPNTQHVLDANPEAASIANLHRLTPDEIQEQRRKNMDKLSSSEIDENQY